MMPVRSPACSSWAVADHRLACCYCRFDAPTAYGHGNGIDDPSMGWSRYAQVSYHQHLLWDMQGYLQPSLGCVLPACFRFGARLDNAA